MRLVVRLKEKLKLELMLIRTRHRILLLLLALPLLHSCCRHNKIGIEEERAISLNVSSTGTKAVVGSLTDMVNQCYNGDNRISGAGFGVYGYKKQADNTSARLFNDILVQPTSKTESPSWEYTPTRYWDSNPAVSYQFIAYWPYLTNDPDELNDPSDPYVSVPEAVNGDYSSKVLTIHNIPNWQPVDGSEMDFMTAVATGKYRSSDQNEALAFSDGTVRFSFSHLLSQVRIEAYSVGTSAPVYIKSLTLNESSAGNDVLAGSGASTDFRQAYNDSYAQPLEQPDVPVAGENYLDLTSSTTLLSGANIHIQYVNELEDNPTTVYTPLGHWLVVPHKWQNLVLTINRKIGDGGTFEDREATITLGAANDYKILAGKKYVITLVFDTTNGGIKVASVAVKDWDEPEEENREVYNW